MAQCKRSRLHDFENSKQFSFLEKKILQFMHHHQKTENSTVQTLQIAKGVGMKTKKDVNRSIYSLEKKGFIKRVQQSPPTWQLLRNEQSSYMPTLPLVQPESYTGFSNPSTFTSQDITSLSSSQTDPKSAVPQLYTAPSTSAFQGRGPQYSKNENVEKHLLDILTDKDGMPLEEIQKLTGSDVGAIEAALENMMQQNKIQLLEGNYSLSPGHYPRQDVTQPKTAFSSGDQGSNKAFISDEYVKEGTSNSDGIRFGNQAPAATLLLPEGKNAISVINEYAQSKRLLIDYQERVSGPDHQRRFHMCVLLGGRRYRGVTGSTKKEAKLKAAEAALAELFQSGVVQSYCTLDNMVYSTSQQERTIHDKVALLVIQKYNELVQQLPDSIVGRKIIAGMVMSKKLKSGETVFQVLSIGSGNRCVAGDKLSLRGETVNDCHAEVIARRGLVRYFYKEIQKFNNNLVPTTESIFEAVFESNNTTPNTIPRLHLKPGIEFHLYISTAPCGDSAIFSPSDANTDQPEQVQGCDHHPLFENKKQGLLRTKVENGEGCIPIDEDTAQPTWDGLLRGERLRTMSCSDKIAKWDFLGLQGSLLTHFMGPVYLSTLTLGMLYNHGHLTRAICCRVEKFISNIKDTMVPVQYTVHHPVVSGQENQSRETGKIKTREFSINWCLGDERPEVLDGTEGKCEQRFGSINPSRLCKAKLFEEFKKACSKLDRPCEETYYKNKMSATSYQEAQALLCEAFDKNGFGKWMHKPREEKDF